MRPMLAVVKPHDLRTFVETPDPVERVERLRRELLEAAGPTRGPVIADWLEATGDASGAELGDRLEETLQSIAAGNVEGLVELALEPRELATLKIKIARELLAVTRRAAGLPWDDPRSIREVRKLVAMYLAVRIPTVPAPELAALVVDHVGFDDQRLRVNMNAIANALWETGHAQRAVDPE